jgi:membrane protein implicated in regulation of membrane protease activity
VLILYVLGGLGVVLLLGGLLLGDTLDSAFDALDAGPGLTAAFGAALTAVGFGGAVLAGPFGLLVGTLLGLGIGLGVGVATLLVVRLALGGPPGRVASSSDLIGLFGTIVSAVPAGGFGAVVLTVRGSRQQVSARCEQPLPAGTPVYVTEVLSATAVVVSRAGLLPSS